MTSVTITLTDEKGGVTASVDFKDGFNIHSDAHQVGNLILKHLDQIMEKREVQDVEAKEITGVAV